MRSLAIDYEDAGNSKSQVVSGDLKKYPKFFWANANRIALFDVGSLQSTHSSAYLLDDKEKQVKRILYLHQITHFLECVLLTVTI